MRTSLRFLRNGHLMCRQTLNGILVVRQPIWQRIWTTENVRSERAIFQPVDDVINLHDASWFDWRIWWRQARKASPVLILCCILGFWTAARSAARLPIRASRHGVVVQVDPFVRAWCYVRNILRP